MASGNTRASSAVRLASEPIEATPTKLLGLISAAEIGVTRPTAQLSASLTLTEVPSRVAMVTVLPSMAEIVPRIRVGGLWAMALAARAIVAKAAADAARRRKGLMFFLPVMPRLWQSARPLAAYFCV